jgi:carnitine O-palmitoyltransferase 1
MYESRGGKKVSLTTKLWSIGVKLLSSKSKPLLYSYQGSLPKLPLPAVKDTMKRVILYAYFIKYGLLFYI